jgi:thioredoxin-like negative regulator of GroEL
LLGRSSDLDPKNVATRIALARSHIATGDDESAAAELRVALGMDASNQPAQLELASLHRRRNEPRAALHLLVNILRRDIYNFDALILLGETLLDLGREQDGRAAFERVVRFDPAHRGARKRLDRLTTGAR